MTAVYVIVFMSHLYLQPPDISGPFPAVSVAEDKAAQTELYAITVTDPEGDTFSCDLNPGDAHFQVAGIGTGEMT